MSDVRILDGKVQFKSSLNTKTWSRYQQWAEGTSFREGDVVPFSKRQFESISRSFSLPKSYLNDFLWSTHITPSVRFVGPNDNKIFGTSIHKAVVDTALHELIPYLQV